MRRVICLLLLALVCLVVTARSACAADCPGLSAAIAPSPELMALMRQYRDGQHAEAVQTLATWSDAQLLKALSATPQTFDLREHAAFVMVLTEAGMRRGTFGRRDQTSLRSFGRDDESHGVHFQHTVPVVECFARLATDSGAGPLTSGLRVLARDWYVAVEAYRARWKTTSRGHEPLSESATRLFPDDPHILLLRAVWIDEQTGPARELTGADGFVSFTPHFGSDDAFKALMSGRPVPGLVTTSHGMFSRRGLQEVEAALRRALELAPTLAEARIRLGRLLYLSDRNTDAAPLLERALRETVSSGTLVLAYWAALQLGQVREQQNDTVAARAAYDTASRIHPAGRSARLALGALAAKQGDMERAWRHSIEALGPPPGDGRGDLDPWVLYPFYQHWRLPQLLASMRGIVQAGVAR